MDVCVLDGHEPLVINKCREACLYFAQAPTDIRISQSSAGYVGHLQLNQPGNVIIQLDHLESSMCSGTQVDDFKARLAQYKKQEIQRLHQLQQKMEEDRKHRAAEEERLKEQRLVEEKDRQIREKQEAMEETVEDSLELRCTTPTLTYNELSIVLPEQIPIPLAQPEDASAATSKQTSTLN
uniref:Uncharacterized protein n=1 Tax=Ditylenchus dipsaci TaxID=166011 RepID=A0A915CW37_9BILA